MSSRRSVAADLKSKFEKNMQTHIKVPACWSEKQQKTEATKASLEAEKDEALSSSMEQAAGAPTTKRSVAADIKSKFENNAKAQIKMAACSHEAQPTLQATRKAEQGSDMPSTKHPRQGPAVAGQREPDLTQGPARSGNAKAFSSKLSFDQSSPSRPVQVWKVIGGQVNGGLVVRMGEDLASSTKPERLKMGAWVEEVSLVGHRLHYVLLRGTGPPIGWISVQMKNMVLAEKLSNVPMSWVWSMRQKMTSHNL